MRMILIAAMVAALAGCAGGGTESTGEPLRATAQMKPTKGHKTVGEVTFEQQGDKVHVVANVKGLTPGKAHGFHIHEVGDCSAPDGMSTKGHFNPFGKQHGYPGMGGHAGDLPALLSDGKGHGKLDVVIGGITLEAGPGNIVGRGLIIHEGPDDYKTQPTGNSGGRIACGVIRLE